MMPTLKPSFPFCLLLIAAWALSGCITPPAEKTTAPAPAPTEMRGCSVDEASLSRQPPCPEPSCPEPSARPGDAVLLKLLEDLARYSNASAEEARRLQTELNNSLSSSDSSDPKGNRIRLALLIASQHTSASDQRAIAQLDLFLKNEKATAALRQIATILRAQIQEHQRINQKLDALRDMDRNLLDERLPGTKGSNPSRP